MVDRLEFGLGAAAHVLLGVEEGVGLVEAEEVLVAALDCPGVAGVCEVEGVEAGGEEEEGAVGLAGRDLEVEGRVRHEEGVLAPLVGRVHLEGVDVRVRVRMAYTKRTTQNSIMRK